VVFQNVATAAGLDFHHVNGASAAKHIAETMGAGGLFFDFDGDGWLDVLLVDGGSLVDPAAAARARHRLFRNRGDGTFTDVSATAGLARTAYGMGGCAADYDNDGRVDVYLTNVGPNVLYHNDGDGRFSDRTRTAGAGVDSLSSSCSFVDVEADGDVDLFVVTYVDAEGPIKACGTGRVRAYCRPDVFRGALDRLFLNNGDGTFTDRSARAGVGGPDGKGLGVVAGDIDDDGRPDLFVANDLAPNFLYRNQGGGVFREGALLSGVAVAADGKVRAGMGTDLADYDGDGRLDLVVTNFEFEGHNLFRNLGNGLFADVSYESGIAVATLPFLGFGVAFVDYDNDTDLDLAIANGHVLDNTSVFRASSRYAQRNLLLVNNGKGFFRDAGTAAGSGFALEKVSRGLVAGDIDNDGDQDLLITNNGQTVDLLRNDGGHRGGALLVRLVGRQSNRDGIGARVRATIGGRTQVREVKAGSSYLGQGDPRVHVGLGGAARVDRLEVRWPNGRTEVIDDVAGGQIVTVTEGLGVTARTKFVAR
ncbi:MAG TPA: CRTAC1 family protein, partial [Vicinamibacterales bacterium]